MNEFYFKRFTIAIAVTGILLLTGTNFSSGQNVGIGTATPLEKLHIIGNVRSSTLAGLGDRLVLADPNGTLFTLSGNTAPGWLTTGNTGTNATNNFIGTLDVNDFVVKTAGAAATNERVRFLRTGEVIVNNIAVGLNIGDVFAVYSTNTTNGANTNIANIGAFAINGYSAGAGIGIYGENAGTGIGVLGNTAGQAGLYGLSNNAAGFGLQAANTNVNGTGIIATGNNLGGLYLVTGSAGSFRAIRFGVLGFSSDSTNVMAGAAIHGTNYKKTILSFLGGAGVTGVDSSAFGSGVIGASYSTFGEGTVGLGNGTSGTGVIGSAGLGASPWGVVGVIPNTAVGANTSLAIFGDNQTNGTNAVGILGQEIAAPNGATRYAIFANGDMAASGTKPFVIDHPLDPANKFLKHFSIESPEVLNLYRGNVVLDGNGEAVVTLPDYFESINNTNYSYNLTPIGQQASLFIKQEIANKQFVIAGGAPGMKVSWMVTSERNDPFLQQNPDNRQAVVTKTGSAAGKYLMPSLYGQPAESGIYFKPIRNHIAISETVGSPPTLNLGKKSSPIN